MRDVVQQLRLAYRSLLRHPGFAIVAVLTLALGIGLSTAVFTVADALLLRRLPVSHQNRLILLSAETDDGHSSQIPLALSDVREFERRSHSLQEVAFFAFRGAVPAPMRSGDQIYPLQLGLVSGSFFDVLQSRAAIGRALRPDDDVAGATPVVVLSHRAWEERFGGDSGVIGRSVSMIYTRRNYTIVGVMPQGLEYPRGTDVWAPLVAYGAAGGFLDVLTGELNVLARLRPGATISQARAELTSFLDRPDAPAWQQNARGVARRFGDVVLGAAKPAILLVALAAALLLVITCVNVANLLLVRTLGREEEFVVRSALGANRGRLVTQLLTESGLLALAGGTVGVALAIAAVRIFVALSPSNAPRIDEIKVNGATLVAAFLITSLTMILSGLGPALFSSRAHGHNPLSSGARHTGGRRLRRVTEALVVAQIALAAVCLTAAGLVTRSLLKLQRVELSFEPGQLLVVTIAMSPDQLSSAQKQRAALDIIASSVQGIAGVRAVTPVMAVPFVGEGGGVDGRMSTTDQSKEERARNPIENIEVAAPNYFAMLGIPVLRGRSFSGADREGSAPVVIISSAVARHFWPDGDPIGKVLADHEGKFTVVGLVPDTRYRELQTARPAVYFPLRQWPDVPSTLLIRTESSPTTIVPAVRRAIGDANTGANVVSTSSLETLLEAPRAQPRLNASIFVLFGLAAVSLAAIGLFGIVTTTVRQRTHELGIRMALGASSGQVRNMIMARGLSLALAGTAIGLAGVFAAGRLISALLFEINPTDGTTLLAVATLILGVAAVASFLPARSGTRVDSVIALRSEG